MKRFRRNRRKLKPGNLLSIGTISIVMVFALGLLGASYASWSQTFNLSSTIHTGEINITLVDVNVEDSEKFDRLTVEERSFEDDVELVDIDIVTESDPVDAIIVFTVKNNGTIPVICEGIDISSQDESLQIELLDEQEKIDVGETVDIRGKIEKGYCEDFKFSTSLKFLQATN